jgi:hypothetical protein
VTGSGEPIAYSGLANGVPVVSSSGRQIGTVEHVLQIPEEDLFDGIVVSTSAGLRFVDRDQIDQITTTQVSCALTDDQADALPAPTGTAVYEADPAADSGTSLHDHFGRLFGRAHWISKD